MSEPLQRLEWDTNFFGFPVARARASSAEELRALTSRADREGIECMYLLLGGAQRELRGVATECGFVHAGHRMTYRCESLSPVVLGGFSGEIRESVAEDLPALEAIARKAFVDSRFFWDPRFPRERAEELYATWLRNSITAGYCDRSLTATLDGQVIGFVTLNLDERPGGPVGRIGLIGVDTSARGRGLGRALVQSAHAAYLERGATRAEVVTQGTNLAAQRLYAHNGYLLGAAEVWLHRWAPPSG